MVRTAISLLMLAVFVVSPTVVHAQYPVVSAQELQSKMKGNKKTLLVDTRSPEEYREGHISGAVNIPAEQIKSRAGMLPKDRTTPIIFYCRGAG